MRTVAYCSPLVPPEWIAAHGLQPLWLQPEGTALRAQRGVCHYAGAVVDTAANGTTADAVVLTTVCDQMRYAAAQLEISTRRPVFLLNVPSTWQTPAAGQLYLDELRRLGRFLVCLGGREPSAEVLRRVMLESEAARSALLAARDRLSARQFSRLLTRLRSGEKGSELFGIVGRVGRAQRAPPSTTPVIRGGARCARPTLRLLPQHKPLDEAGFGETVLTPFSAVPLALLGGPLVEKDDGLLDLVEQAGGRVALDGSEGGQRTLPAPWDGRRLDEDPLRELARAYFDAIPDVFRRPNDGLYAWLDQQFAACGIRGVIFRRYVWCDLWHAELHRLRQWSPLPVLEIDVNHDDHGVPARIAGRVEAFLEMLR
jgi:benzoyl-CoA reductase/2-hydroxyglutaryl-CoA dehydratase subunit BcrC/BadD/HgdB